MTIRETTHADIPAMVAMGAALCAEAPAYEGLTYSPERTAETVQMLVDAPHGLALVSERDGALTGYILAIAYPRTFHEGLAAVELSLYVARSHRGSRAAIRLIEGMVEWARKAGASTIDSGTSTGFRTERTVALYQRLGFALSGATLQKGL